MMNRYLKSPFPYFGGKSTVASVVWDCLGNPEHYIEPFCGSAAVLLNRPNGLELDRKFTETINDFDGHIANVWRSLKYQPEETAKYADDIVCHVDLFAKRNYINNNYGELLKLLSSNPEACNPRMAGYYIWAMSCWIGAGLTTTKKTKKEDEGLRLGQRPHISNRGMGINASLRQIPRLSDKGTGINSAIRENIYEWFKILQKRLRNVRIVNGDWKQVLGGNWQDRCWNTVGIFFDPPYSDKAGRDKTLYSHDSLTIAHEVREYCIKHGNKKHWRIVLAGYYDEHKELLEHGWEAIRWKAVGGYSNTGKTKNPNRFKEALFISPHCNKPNQQLSLI